MFTALGILLSVVLMLPPKVNGVTYKNYILYIAGTATGDKSASSFQSDWQWIAQAMQSSARLNIPMNSQAVINYTNALTTPFNPKYPTKPAVISSYNSTSPTVKSGCRVTIGGKLITDAWAHAVSTAWKISQFISEQQINNPGSTPKIILIGHSQGSLIARMIQLVVAGKTTGLPSDLLSKCWPTTELKDRIVGIVGMGTPLAGAENTDLCSGFPDLTMKQERIYASKGSSFSAGRVMMIGAAPLENVYLPLFTPTINNECSTYVFSDQSIRVNIFSEGYPSKISSLTVGAKYSECIGSGVCIEYRDATMTTSQLHNLSVGEYFKIEGAIANSALNKKWKVKAVVGTTQRTLTFQVPFSINKAEPPTDKLLARSTEVQSHGWWIEGKGVCPTGIIKPGRGDGNAPTPFCGYVKIVNNSTTVWPTTFTAIESLESSGNPGTVYDLISATVKSWFN